ncbi:MAG: DUF3829 domain-containing protein [Ignavibacteria bacterium]
MNTKTEKIEQNREETKGKGSEDDMQFYNKYIAVMNKLQDNGEKIYKDYISNIPEPSSITKNSFIISVSFQISVSFLERSIKDYKRSYYDGGELSKLNASDAMKNEIESDFKNLLTTLEEYHASALKISDYYSKGEYKNDLSKAKPYDEEIKSIYNRYKIQIRKFSDDLKKFKPERELRDPTSIKDPDERASIVMLNSYENILDAAEDFYDTFDDTGYQSDLAAVKSKFDQFKIKFEENKNTIVNSEFTERTKHLKYSFEDYFVKSVTDFTDAGQRFFENAPSARNEKIYNVLYNEVVEDYNRMIESYNSSISSINMTLKVYQ